MSTRSGNAAASSASSASSRSCRAIPRARARIVAERSDKSSAAIASKLAAEIYGLDILAEDIEDETHNTTRFVVLAREANWAEQGSGPLVTTFVFRVRNLPAALYKAMGGFATNGVNMTKLESYMVDGNFFATQFYADVDGHPDDRGLAFALEELKFFSREFRIVGVYPAHPFRATFSETAGLSVLTQPRRNLPHRAARGAGRQRGIGFERGRHIALARLGRLPARPCPSAASRRGDAPTPRRRRGA